MSQPWAGLWCIIPGEQSLQSGVCDFPACLQDLCRQETPSLWDRSSSCLALAKFGAGMAALGTQMGAKPQFQACYRSSGVASPCCSPMEQSC